MRIFVDVLLNKCVSLLAISDVLLSGVNKATCVFVRSAIFHLFKKFSRQFTNESTGHFP